MRGPGRPDGPEEGRGDMSNPRTPTAVTTLFSALNERAKELSCLYRIEEILSLYDVALEDVFRQVIEAIPPAGSTPSAARPRSPTVRTSSSPPTTRRRRTPSAPRSGSRTPRSAASACPTRSPCRRATAARS
ncbi:MAG: hypothetical protein M0C28_14815 [Candidatus Moduliflexus flocculans]|nr:hypothetical protein [Candidatus Moduliflexus flocculans]